MNATKAARRHEAAKLRGYAKLMSDLGKHELAAELMRQAKQAVRK